MILGVPATELALLPLTVPRVKEATEAESTAVPTNRGDLMAFLTVLVTALPFSMTVSSVASLRTDGEEGLGEVGGTASSKSSWDLLILETTQLSLQSISK